MKILLKNVCIACFFVNTSINLIFATNNNGVRVSWDYNSYFEQTEVKVVNKDYIETECFYPRIKKLKDGSLLMVFMNHRVGYDIFVRKSYDNGLTWSDAYMVRQRYEAPSPGIPNDIVVFSTPDFIQLNDGRVLLAYQWRFEKGYNDSIYTNQNCGVEVMVSEDGGNTFSNPKIIYYGRCWEPYFLQLPSGELQMYITDSSEFAIDRKQSGRYALRSLACTILIRSFDNGKTWQGKEVVSYRDGECIARTINEKGKFDGMPAAKYLKENNGIAMAIETWSATYQFDHSPYIVYSPGKENWKYRNNFIREKGGPEIERKKQLNKDFRGFGPYMEILPQGEILVQSNGIYKGQQGMWVFIGDKKADNFTFASSPYVGYWGSIAYIDNDEVISAGTFMYNKNEKERSGIKVIKGKLNYAKEIKRDVLKHKSLDSFDKNNNNYWFIGHATSSSVYIDFGYSKDAFEFSTYLFDKNLVAFTPDNSDAVDFLLHRINPKNGEEQIYHLAINAKGVFTLQMEKTNSWIPQDATKVQIIDFDQIGTINNSKDKDYGFSAKVSIPWKLIGGYPAKEEKFQIHLRHRYKDEMKEYPFSLLESLPGENSDIPDTWLSVSFK